jgi:hypothetical protein
MFNHILYNLIQVLVVMAFAPLASGVLSRMKEIVQSKRGPSIFQPYRDLWKLFHKDEIVSEDSSWIFRFTPYIVFVVPIFVTLLIPVLTNYPLFLAFMGDMIGAGFILSLGGFFATLAAIDTANPYGPVGAHGRLSGRTGFYDRLFHRLLCGRLNDSLHRPGKVGDAAGKFFHAVPCAAGAGVSHVDSGRRRTHSGGQSNRPF